MKRSMYYVEYRMHSADDYHGIQVCAGSKWDAYLTATYDAIPAKEGEPPYSAWVVSVTYQNGNRREFYTHEGKPV